MNAEPRYIFGRHPVLEALRAEPQALRALLLAAPQKGPQKGPSHASHDAVAEAQKLAQSLGLPIKVLHRANLERLLGGAVTHQGVALEAEPFAYASLEDILARGGERPLVVVLDQIQDPHNLGAIARSAQALGAHGLVIGKDRSADITSTAIKAAAGATAHLPIARVTNLSRALTTVKKAGLWIVGTDVGEGARPVYEVDFTLPVALVIGNEGTGMRPLTARQCDFMAHIPMDTIGSLNASAAAAICLYEALRQRRG